MNAATMHPHLQAADLALQIADEASRVLIETRAGTLATNYPRPCYDTTRLDLNEAGPPEFHAQELADLARAVRYLDLRGVLVRPFADQPQYISFGRAA